MIVQPIEPVMAECNERALLQIRDSLANASTPQIDVDVDMLRNALYGRIGEVAEHMRAANLTDDERARCEITLHNLAQIVMDFEDLESPPEASPFHVEDLRVIFGVEP
jgi:hypothetical protein